jgi:hypothetical protein
MASPQRFDNRAANGRNRRNCVDPGTEPWDRYLAYTGPC